MAIKVKVDLSGLKRVRQELFDRLAGEQTQRLIAYAPELLKKAYSESGFTDQTYNLADSYIWAVFYQGNLKGSGYLYPYQMATKNSKYHSKLIDGRKLADEFLANYTPATYIGWDLVLAATVPYAPILEGGNTGNPRRRFEVLSTIYDDIKEDFAGKATVKTVGI